MSWLPFNNLSSLLIELEIRNQFLMVNQTKFMNAYIVVKQTKFMNTSTLNKKVFTEPQTFNHNN